MKKNKNNDYWSAYILKAKKSTFVEIEIEYEIKNTAIDKIKCLWLDIEWVNYGPFGFSKDSMVLYYLIIQIYLKRLIT